MILPTWQKNMLQLRENLELIEKSQKKFRTDVSAIPASSIAQQFFCEMKVEQDYVQGEIETEAKSEGTALHEKLLAMEKSTVENIAKDIATGQIVIVSMPLVSEFDNLTLIGVPDAIVFVDKIPTHVVELKTTARGDVTRIFDSQKAQALIYGLLLDQMGFDCEKLELTVVRYKTSALPSGKDKQKFLGVLVTRLLGGTTEKIATDWKGEIFPHLFRYKRSDVIEILNRTKGYWLKQREPFSSTSPNKCRSCEFGQSCPKSLVRSMYTRDGDTR